MEKRKYNLFSFGCQMNVADMEFLTGVLQGKGWEPEDDLERCDLILMNTCVVRETAEQRARARLAQLKPLKASRPELMIGVAGCLAQKEGRQILEDFPFVDMVVGTRELHKVGMLVDELGERREQHVCVEDIDKPTLLPAEPLRGDNLKGFLTITYGCDNDCTFCIVPTTRGREWSRPANDLVDEVHRLVDAGYKEVTLLGQNVNSYHDGTHDFSDLMRRIDRETGIARIRFTTSNPQDTTDKLLDTMAETPSVCEHHHLPVQAGNNRVLREMARKYTRERYIEIIEGLRARMPEIAITTDIIVGFPGETYEEFLETKSLAEIAQWDGAYTFVYNARGGTPAARLADKIPVKEKKKWLAELIEVTERITVERNAAEVGRVAEALVEGPSRRNAAQSMGRTRGNKVVVLEDDAAKRGDIVTVEITDAGAHTLFGRVLSGTPAAAVV